MKIRVGVLIVLICLSGIIYGQETPPNTESDTQMWEAFGIDIEVHPIFKVYLEKQLRYQDRFSNLRSDIMEVGGRLRLNKFAAIRANYRYTIRDNDKRYRFDANLQLNFKVKNFRLATRSRIQSEYIEDGIFNDSELELRNRFKITYRTKKAKLRPYFASELFLGLRDNKRDRNKLRLTLGTDWRVKKRVSIKFFYHFQTDLVPERSERSHIFGTKFNYSF
jgi:Protein of unknown function (DUF2490)